MNSIVFESRVTIINHVARIWQLKDFFTFRSCLINPQKETMITGDPSPIMIQANPKSMCLRKLASASFISFFIIHHSALGYRLLLTSALLLLASRVQDSYALNNFVMTGEMFEEKYCTLSSLAWFSIQIANPFVHVICENLKRFCGSRKDNFSRYRLSLLNLISCSPSKIQFVIETRTSSA